MAFTFRFSSLLVLTLMMVLFIPMLSSIKSLAAWFYAFGIFIPSYHIIYDSPSREKMTSQLLPLRLLVGWIEQHSILSDKADSELTLTVQATRTRFQEWHTHGALLVTPSGTECFSDFNI